MYPREDYTHPVGFAREPSEERRRWFGRILTAGFILFIAWLAWARVFNPPSDTPQVPSQPPQQQQQSLPAPR